MPSQQSKDRQVTVYRSQTRLAKTPLDAIDELVRELWRHRWHVSIKYKNTFKSRFNQTAFGIIWQFIEPLLPISAYALLAYIAVFPTRDDMPALVYIAIGLTLWMLMTDLVTRQMAALQSNAAILNKTRYPLAAVLAEAFAQSAFETVVRILAGCVIFGLLIGAPPWQAVIVLPMLIPPLLLALGAGMIFSVLNSVYRDVENIIQIIFRYGFFLSLTIFPLPSHPIVDRLLAFNPFAVYIDAIRNAVVFGAPPHALTFGIWTVLAVAIFIGGCNLIYVMEPRLKGFL
ncbi:ABC transporter permease [Hyphobacterium sp. HN65]|uniref:ABC transporter permease n=1 Tax=Hyphobacterium lacteum TaxID=3116575 RepID=A0ABU7LRC4_9PROT|nr:ABC transporter permease [Hyphobacterium sp. HN65]MEE2525869.1 ABC transporter permease [Hyphobacterium sp. HN65]